jgi:hypothetical protein
MLPINKIKINLYSITLQAYLFITFLAIPIIIDSLITNYAYGTENSSPYRVLNYSTQFIAFYIVFIFYLIGSKFRIKLFEKLIYIGFFLFSISVILQQFNLIMHPVVLRSFYYDYRKTYIQNNLSNDKSLLIHPLPLLITNTDASDLSYDSKHQIDWINQSFKEAYNINGVKYIISNVPYEGYCLNKIDMNSNLYWNGQRDCSYYQK